MIGIVDAAALLLGLDLPVVPMLHQYLVTDTVPAIAARTADGLAELAMIRDPEESWYLRQERDGYVLGAYESQGRPWAVDGVPKSHHSSAFFTALSISR